jgi:hypothetical protein
MKNAVYLILSILLFTACVEAETGVQYKSLRIKKQYRIKIPTYMKRTKELNDEASLQYMNGRREAYVVVLDEDKQEFINAARDIDEYNDSLSNAENYKKIQMEYYKLILSDFKMYDEKTTDFRGNPSFYTKVDGEMYGMSVTYFFRFVEGKEHMYTLLCWTEQRRKPMFRYTFSEILGSFSEVR